MDCFDSERSEYTRRDAITDWIHNEARKKHGPKGTKEDIFYYVYGILHSPGYRTTYANDLKKMLPRLPLLDNAEQFKAFSKAGRELADLHINYEKRPAPAGVLVNKKPPAECQFTDNQLIVHKMQFGNKVKKDSIIYNDHITVSNIPPRAYEYVINGKSAIEWIVERYAVTVHKESGIRNDPNDWGREHGDPRYILDLLLSIITVSLRTVDIVEGLPEVAWA